MRNSVKMSRVGEEGQLMLGTCRATRRLVGHMHRVAREWERCHISCQRQPLSSLLLAPLARRLRVAERGAVVVVVAAAAAGHGGRPVLLVVVVGCGVVFVFVFVCVVFVFVCVRRRVLQFGRL